MLAGPACSPTLVLPHSESDFTPILTPLCLVEGQITMFKKLSHSRSSRRRPTHRSRRFEALERRNLLTFIAQIGGDGYDYHTSSAIDDAGNIYLGGRFRGTADFDPGPGTDSHTSEYDTAFVAKYDPNGAIIWSRALGIGGATKGGKPGTSPFAMTTGFALDDAGGVYITGHFRQSIDFTREGGSFISSAGDFDVFVAKLDASDGDTLWAKTMGGSGSDVVMDIAVADDYVYTTGGFRDTVDFDPGSGTAILTTSGNGEEGFVLKLDTNGSFSHAWSVGNRVEEIVLDGSNVFVTGMFSGEKDFDPDPNNIENLTSVGNDYFFASYTNSGDYNWAQRLGNGQGLGYRTSLAVDAMDLYFAAQFQGPTFDVDPSASILNLTSTGNKTAFLAKYSKSTGLLDSNFEPKQFPSSDTVKVRGGLMLGPAGEIYMGISYWGTLDLDPGPAVTCTDENSVVLKLDASGNYLEHWYSGGYTAEPIEVINNTLYVAGNFLGTATLPTGDTLTEFGGGGDIYLLGLDVGPPPAPSFSVNDVEVIEGDVGTVIAEFTVTRSGDSSVEVSVDVSTSDDTATIADGDYVAVGTTTLVFGPGVTSLPVSVTVNSDVVVEGNDAFFLNLANATGGATIADPQGVGTIVDDDSVIPTIRVADLDGTASPGSRGKWDATVTVTVLNSLGQPMAGVEVTGFWSDDPSTPVTMFTNANGQVTITNSNINKNTSSVSFTISSLSLTGFVYDQAANDDPDGDSDGTVIQVLKP